MSPYSVVRACMRVPKVQAVRRADNALPVAHTCFNTIDLPASYKTPEHLSKQLNRAIEEGNAGGFLIA